jgi:hypothetical protein
MMPPCDLHDAGRDKGRRSEQMTKQRKISTKRQALLPRIPLPPQKRQQASASKRRKFVDEPMVQPTLFDLDEGGAK